MKQLEKLLKGRPLWVKEAALRLLKAGAATEVDLDGLIDLCRQEAENPKLISTPDLSTASVSETSQDQLRLKSIGNIEGINRLAPKEPLIFGEHSLAVVYGLNGSGKTGYVRILKNCCGARDPGSLKPNVSAPPPTKQGCQISFSLGKSEKKVAWEPSDGPIVGLNSVDIFDSREGWVYVTDENEVAYEPRLLLFLTDLITICDGVRSHYASKIESLRKSLIDLPEDYEETRSGIWFSSISGATKTKGIESGTAWTQADQEKLDLLLSLKKGESPKDRADALTRKIRNLQGLLEELEGLSRSLSFAECKKLRGLFDRANTLRTVVDTAAAAAFSDSPLDGVGTPEWKQLWEYARAYSVAQAYPGLAFPNVGDGARCVLCQEPLSDGGINRLQSFEDFVKGKAEADAKTAKAAFGSALIEVGLELDLESLGTRMDAAGLREKADRDLLVAALDALQSRLSWVSSAIEEVGLKAIPDLSEWSTRARAQIPDWTRSAEALLAEGDKPDGTGDRESEINELEAKKWVSGQKAAITSEVTRLKEKGILEDAWRSASTTALSKRKGDLSKSLITDAFSERFRKEMEKLGARRLGVELKKTRTEKGHTLHQLHYHGVKGRVLSDVLSEGEFRVVSLAACLADAAGNEFQSPFVFDDPISSLDQDFEEAVVHRLVKLSEDRQIIVFTHRLSLLSLIEEAAKKNKTPLDISCVRAEQWGAGEPGGIPINAKKPDKALNKLRNEVIPQAKKILGEDGREAYYPHAKQICSDFRILLERVIESNLLNNVVLRYRRSVQTDGRLGHLARIEKKDCEYLDNLMTKYSRYEHSQPLEAPVDPPDPDELTDDVDGLISWIAGFANRT